MSRTLIPNHPRLRSVLLYLTLLCKPLRALIRGIYIGSSFLSHRSNIATQRRGLQGTAESLGKFKYVGEFKNGKFSGKVRSRLAT